MRHLLLVSCCFLTLTACSEKGPALNPDPNHTHADFAVWIEGKKIDFSQELYMSGSSKEGEDHSQDHHMSLHLHDGNGAVIHRHKPGLTLGDFFNSLPGIRYRENEFLFMDCLGCAHAEGTYQTKLFVNGEESPEGSVYVFSDIDRIVITDTTDPALRRAEVRDLTDEACLYSRTCPERGDPPTENCIADPTVPCIIP